MVDAINDPGTILEVFRISPTLFWCLVQIKGGEYGILIDPLGHNVQMLDVLTWDSSGAYWSARFGPEKVVPVARMSTTDVLKRRAFEMVKEESDRKRRAF